VIVAGLDECDGHEIQQLSNSLLRFLIASRPEAHIHEAFDQPTLRSITMHVVLDESFGPNQDIEKYGFESIY
jgi:hypothetical protein